MCPARAAGLPASPAGASNRVRDPMQADGAGAGLRRGSASMQKAVPLGTACLLRLAKISGLRMTGYRPDIDGLRALAVTSVVLFHARLEPFSGGFVGVDVFFVISGFLITGVILGHEGTTGEFLKRFYERRIRRLLPPVVPVLAFTSLFAYALLPPDALEEYARSLVAFIVFASNWFFWTVSGYFDGPAQYKPLLHTWSLSIEEQFYLLFPICVLFLARFGRGAVVGFFAAVLILSLGHSVYLVRAGEPESAFFSSFGRFWEIGLGSLLACGIVRAPSMPAARDALGLTGVAMILFAVLAFDEHTAFPGLNALFPTVGAALVILANGGVVGRLLSFPPIVGIGLISYALYLWHWPIFVFIDTYFAQPRPWHFAGGIVVSVALATASYFFIEVPVRMRLAFPTRRAAFSLFAAIAPLFAAAGIAGAVTGGLPDRFPGYAAYTAHLNRSLGEQRMAASINKCWVAGNIDFLPVQSGCVSPEPGRRNIILLGDSHAAQFFDAIKETFPDSNVDLAAVNSCLLVKSRRAACNMLADWVDSGLSNAGYDAAIISVRAGGLYTAEVVAPRVKEIAQHIPVTLLGPIHFYKPNMPTLYPTLVGSVPTARIEEAFDRAVQESQFAADAYYRAELDGSSVNYVSLLDILCPDGKSSCRHFDQNGWPILVDNSHMSIQAAREIIAEVKGRIVQPATVTASDARP